VLPKRAPNKKNQTLQDSTLHQPRFGGGQSGSSQVIRK